MIASVNLRSLSAPKQAARLLTIAEAAHTYKLCAATLRAWTNTGKLPDTSHTRRPSSFAW